MVANLLIDTSSDTGMWGTTGETNRRRSIFKPTGRHQSSRGMKKDDQQREIDQLIPLRST
jgi:hypothetical protein